MSDLQGLAIFPGVRQIISARYTLKHGITPGKAVLELPPLTDFTVQQGTLEFAFGSTHLTFPDCRVERHSLRHSAAGNTWKLTLLDRRWKWAFGQISGSYNLRHDDGTLVAGTERTPQQLAALCLAAMGERGGDVADLPNRARPRVEWDYDNPARALAQLADGLGCRVVLNLNNRVSLRRLGTGGELPLDGVVIDDSRAIDATLGPDRVTVVTGRNRYQVDFPLEAVAVDRDGTIKPLDELSYRPAGGWQVVDLEHFQAASDRTLREAAQASVFRWYRVAVPAHIPGARWIRSLDEILPLEEMQVETTTDAQGITRSRPAEVFGVWSNYPLEAINRADELRPLSKDRSGDDMKTIVTTGFQLDRQRALVKFAAPVICYDAQSRPAPARLVLRAAVGLRDARQRAWRRNERTRASASASSDTRDRFLVHDEIVPATVPSYDPHTYTVVRVFDNSAAVALESDAYLDAAVQASAARRPRTITYAGLRAVDLDGALQHIEWVVGPDGATTRVSRDAKQSPLLYGYGRRRLIEKLQDLDRCIQKPDSQAASRAGQQAPVT